MKAMTRPARPAAAARPRRHRGVRAERRAARRAAAADDRDDGVLRAGDRGRRRIGARPADRRAGVLGARSVGRAGGLRDRADRLVHAAAGGGKARCSNGPTRSGWRSIAVLGTAKALAYGVEPVPAIADGRGDRLRRRDHPRRARRAALDPDAARALRHRRRACRRAVRAGHAGRPAAVPGLGGRRAGRVRRCAARR